MSEPTSSGLPPHAIQTALDNQWLVLFLGLTVPTVIYLLWGAYDILNIPVGK